MTAQLERMTSALLLAQQALTDVCPILERHDEEDARGHVRSVIICIKEAMLPEDKLTLPPGYKLYTAPSGIQSVISLNDPGHSYSLDAWRLIEEGRGLWRHAHNAIFGKGSASDER